MKRVFRIQPPRRVPDRTLVAGLLNPLDGASQVKVHGFDEFSIAAGIIEAGARSMIHVMPHVSQVTFVRRGELTAIMKGPQDPTPYRLQVKADQAILTRPGTLLQLCNQSRRRCEVLYIVSPAYLYVARNKRQIYDDAVVLEEDWRTLEKNGWRLSVALPSRRARALARGRIATDSASALQTGGGVA